MLGSMLGALMATLGFALILIGLNVWPFRNKL